MPENPTPEKRKTDADAEALTREAIPEFGLTEHGLPNDPTKPWWRNSPEKK